MTIEGVQEFEALRDFLYSRMRGVKDGHAQSAAPVADSRAVMAAPPADALTAALREVAHELRAVREALARRESGVSKEPPHV
jgi:putative membrane protein